VIDLLGERLNLAGEVVVVDDVREDGDIPLFVGVAQDDVLVGRVPLGEPPVVASTVDWSASASIELK